MNLQEMNDKDYEPLIPIFKKNQKEVIDAMEEALSVCNYNEIKFLTHRLRGTANNYGFMQLGQLGSDLDDLTDLEEKEKMYQLLNEMKVYLEKVQIIYVEI